MTVWECSQTALEMSGQPENVDHRKQKDSFVVYLWKTASEALACLELKLCHEASCGPLLGSIN